MKETEVKTTLRILEPAENSWITQVKVNDIFETVFSKKVYLAVNDSPENWKEITDDEKQKIEAEIKKAEDIKFKKYQQKD